MPPPAPERARRRSTPGRSTRPTRSPRDDARPAARPGAAARPRPAGAAARRRRLRRGAHADAGGQRRDGRLVVRLARRRPAALPDLASGGARGEQHRARRRVAARRRTGTPSTTRSRTSAPAACARGSPSCRRRGSASRPTRSTTRAWRRSSAAEVGDDTRRMRHTLMVHVFLRDGRRRRAAQPLLARRADPPVPARRRSATPARWALNRRARAPRRRCRAACAPALARHCAEEYANLAALLPELHRRFSGSSGRFC